MFSYKELDGLVRQYQLGDPEAGEKLIKSFEGFLVKFLNIIKGSDSKLDISGNHIFGFLSLYIKNKNIRRIIRAYWRYPDVAKELFQKISWIQEMFKDFSREEILTELTIILLEMAKKYKVRDDGIYCFHTYVSKAFHYRAFRRLQKLIADPIVYAANTIVDYQDCQLLIEDNYDTIDILAYQSGRIINEDSIDGINENWVNGLTCSEAFKKLSIIDRRILQLYYVYNLSDQKIASKLGLCRATVNRKRLSAKGYITNYISNQ